MGSIFDQERSFWRILNKISDIVILNFIFVISSLPIITAGTAYSAMYYTMMKSVRKNRGYLVKNYIHSFIQNLAQGIISWLIFLVLGGGCAMLVYGSWHTAVSGGPPQYQMWLAIVVLLFLICIFIYYYPVLSRFHMSTKNMFVLSYLMSIKYILNTVLLLILLTATVIGCIICIPLLIIVLPGLYCFLSSFIIEKVMAVYMVKFEKPEDSAPAANDDNSEGLVYIGAAAKERMEAMQANSEKNQSGIESEGDDTSESNDISNSKQSQSDNQTEHKKDQWYYNL